MQKPEITRGEVIVMSAGLGIWWVHTLDQHGDSGVLISSHRNKRIAVKAAARSCRDLNLDLVIWGDNERA